MLEEIRKGLLTGFGAVFLTREKIEEVIRKLVKETRLSPEDAQRLKEELLATGERQWREAEEYVSKAVGKGLDSINVPGHAEYEELKARVEKLEKTLFVIEKSLREKE